MKCEIRVSGPRLKLASKTEEDHGSSAERRARPPRFCAHSLLAWEARPRRSSGSSPQQNEIEFPSGERHKNLLRMLRTCSEWTDEAHGQGVQEGVRMGVLNERPEVRIRRQAQRGRHLQSTQGGSRVLAATQVRGGRACELPGEPQAARALPPHRSRLASQSAQGTGATAAPGRSTAERQFNPQTAGLHPPLPSTPHLPLDAQQLIVHHYLVQSRAQPACGGVKQRQGLGRAALVAMWAE